MKKQLITIVFIFIGIYVYNISQYLYSPEILAFYMNHKMVLIKGNMIQGFDLSFESDIPDAQNKWVEDSVYINPNAPSPYRFRKLGNQIVWKTSSLFHPEEGVGFYRSFIFWNGVFLLGGVLGIYFLVNCLFRGSACGLWGCLLLFLMPPMLGLFKYPMLTTANDTLTFFLMVISMLSITMNKPIIAMLVTCVGVFCRETILLIPYLYILFSDESIGKRFLWLIPGIIWLLFRLIVGQGNPMGYSAIDGLWWNIKTWNQSLWFLATIFGFLWPLAFVGYFKAGNRDNLAFFRKSFIPAVLTTLFFHIIFARVEEMRISFFILAPFFVIFSLVFFQRYIDRIIARFKNIRFWLSITVLVVLISMLNIFVINSFSPQEAFIKTGIFGSVYYEGLIGYLSLLNLGILPLKANGWTNILFFEIFLLGSISTAVLGGRGLAGLGVPEPAVWKGGDGE